MIETGDDLPPKGHRHEVVHTVRRPVGLRQRPFRHKDVVAADVHVGADAQPLRLGQFDRLRPRLMPRVAYARFARQLHGNQEDVALPVNGRMQLDRTDQLTDRLPNVGEHQVALAGFLLLQQHGRKGHVV